MSLFQTSVINKYLKTLDKQALQAAYTKFKAHFHNPAIQENIRNSKEEQYQGEFLIDLFVNVLGYTKNPAVNFNLTTEFKNVKDNKKADGAIVLSRGHAPLQLQAPLVVGVIELKGTNTTDLGHVEAQAFGYKNNQPECVYVITSNFEKLRLYIDNAIEHLEFNLFTLSEKDFELLYLCLAYSQIEKGIPKKIKDESISHEDEITKQLYRDYSSFKRELHADLVEKNPTYDPLLLFRKTQKLLSRFLFLFFAEDRQLLPPNSVRLILNDWRDLQDRDVEIALYNRFKKYFEYLNTGFKGKRYDVFAYNGGLFKHDDVLDTVQIDDELLYHHTAKISEYDFASEVDVNILGHIFENSLNELDELKAEIAGESIDKSKSKRKKDGVFYTPKYITKYIVDNTVGKLCDERRPLAPEGESKLSKKEKEKYFNELKEYRNWLLQITICDPACGSGAFLNQALNFLIDEHRYIDELQAKLFGDSLVLTDIENTILENNLFGVDLNEESVEIAKLSLWLRTAQPNRKLNDLSRNIKCGNSLIDDPAVAGEKAFDWEKEFPQVFAQKQKMAWHITTATHNSRYSQRMFDNYIKLGEPVWISEKEELIVSKTIAEIAIKDKLDILAYNICGDHMHLLLVCEKEEVDNIVGKLKSMSARACNIAMGRTIPTPTSIPIPTPTPTSGTRGHAPLSNPILPAHGETQTQLWTQKFGKKEITSDEQLYNTLRYIENNRVKHELTDIDKDLQPLINEMKCNTQHAFRTEYKGGFDVVIGNPPYVLCQQSNTDEIKLDYYKTFEVASYKIDLFHLFFERAVNLLKLNGKLGFITPNTYLSNKYTQKLRNFILKNTKIEFLVNYNEVVFVDAGVDVATLILTKKKEHNNQIQILNSEKAESSIYTTKSQVSWNEDSEQVFNIKIDFEIELNDCVCLEEIGNTYFGIQAYDRKSSISDDKLSDKFLPMIDGADIFSYKYSVPNKYFNYISSNIKSGGDWTVYEKERIVIRQIGQVPIVGYCSAEILTSNTIYNLYLTDKSYSLKYVFAILNSSLIKAYWMSKYNDNKDLFPKIKGYQLKQLPIKITTETDQQPFITKADQMLSLNKELQEISGKFQRNLLREFSLETLTSKLQNWHTLSYAEFIKELEKQKVKLTLSQKAEWETYFNQEAENARTIKTEIDTTDNEIDRMVYALYGLTDEEIKIVEQK